MVQKFKATIAFPETSSKSQSSAKGQPLRQKQSRRQRLQTKVSSTNYYFQKHNFLPSGTSSTSAPIARLPGMSDLKEITFSYNTGYIEMWLPGTNTASAGTYNNLYLMFADNANNKIAVNAVPVAPADPQLGQTYVTDVMKHFQRRIVHKVLLCIEPLITSTTTYAPNTNEVFIHGLGLVAPIRGGNFTTTWTARSAAGMSTATGYPVPGIADLESISGSVPFKTWESCCLDLTPYIAGGSGSKQNEFNIATSATQQTPPSQASNSNAVPVGFVIGGGCGSSSNTSTTDTWIAVARVRIITTISLVDYTGSLISFQYNNSPSLREDYVDTKVSNPIIPQQDIKNSQPDTDSLLKQSVSCSTSSSSSCPLTTPSLFRSLPR